MSAASRPSVAILQRQTLHTEVAGAIAALAHAAGYDVYIYYNRGDPWEMVTYFATQAMPWIRGTGDWTVPFTRPETEYTRIVLTTSDEWRRVPRTYRRTLATWESQGRLLVVHHDLCYLPMYEGVYRTHVGLTPAYPRWLFPLYAAPSTRSWTPSAAAMAAAAVTGVPAFPPLVCVGAVASKDQDNIRRYMDAGGHVHHYVRYEEEGLIAAYPDMFHSHGNSSGVALMQALQATVGRGAGHMWFPVPIGSGYVDVKFTGALTLGVDVQAILVMPRALQQTYGFPDAAVVTYEAEITEPATLARLRETAQTPGPCLEALRAWACTQWTHGMGVWTAATHAPPSESETFPESV